MTIDTEQKASGATVPDRDRSHRRRSFERRGSLRGLRAPLVDFNCHLIRPGDIVTVATADWSLGTAKWMQHSEGTVVTVGRTRVEVRFHGLEGSHHLPARLLSIVAEQSAI